MTAIFSDLIEQIMEVFMDDFTIYGKTFDNCLINLEKVFKRCKEVDLVLNWEKCHFMVREGIVLGHLIFKRRIEVDKAKIQVLLLPPSLSPPPSFLLSSSLFLLCSKLSSVPRFVAAAALIGEGRGR